MVHQFLSHLLKKKSAAIVNVSSGIAFMTYSSAPVYSALKAGVRAYTQALRLQLEEGNIKLFDYSTNEALFLSDKEENVINDIVRNIRNEYHSNIDKFNQDIIISNLETLLNYAERFYQRQFITRKISSHQIHGLPSVQYIAERLNISPKYLSSPLKQLVGQTTQQIIHEKLIDKAKEKLSTTELSVSETAYQLGFENSQSFNKLFKSKTRLSPLEFRQSFN